MKFKNGDILVCIKKRHNIKFFTDKKLYVVKEFLGRSVSYSTTGSTIGGVISGGTTTTTTSMLFTYLYIIDDINTQHILYNNELKKKLCNILFLQNYIRKEKINRINEERL